VLSAIALCTTFGCLLTIDDSLKNRAALPADAAADAAADAPPSSYADTVRADAPVAYFRLGERPGATTAESAVGSARGTYRGAPELGVRGALMDDTAVRFARGDFVFVGRDALSFDANRSFTIEAWVRSDSDAEQCVLGRIATVDGADHGILLVVSRERKAAFVRQHDNLAQLGGQRALPSGAFAHVVAVYEAPVMRLYVDGELDGSTTDDVPIKPGSADLTIAARTPGFPCFDGALDEVAVYASALSADAVRRHHEAARLVR
jgi:hypothetical protein